MDCKQAENLAKCSCTKLACARRGLCCDCLAAHLASKTLPRCCFPADPDSARDRSFAGFAKAWKV